MLDKNKVKLGIAPIAWTNDDMPDLGAENTFEQCISEMALAGFTGCEVGNKYPRDTAVLKKALSLRGMEICNAWFSSFLTTKPYEEVEKDFIEHITFLKEMGARISVNGQESIIIEGVNKLEREVYHSALCDNMQALTYLIAGGIAGKELFIHNFPFADLEIPLVFLRFSGLSYYQDGKDLIVRKCNPYPVDISTGPYPGINSDMQPLFAVWGALSQGTSTITDLRFVGRYGYAEEFAKMGVKSEVDNNRLLIYGGHPIVGGQTVTALDLRAGAALLLLSLVADSPTMIDDFWMIERGYDNLVATLTNLGIKIC